MTHVGRCTDGGPVKFRERIATPLHPFQGKLAAVLTLLPRFKQTLLGWVQESHIYVQSSCTVFVVRKLSLCS